MVGREAVVVKGDRDQAEVVVVADLLEHRRQVGRIHHPVLLAQRPPDQREEVLRDVRAADDRDRRVR